MDQQDPFKFVALLPTSYPSDLASLQALIQGCQDRNPKEQEELLFRYTRHFIGTIRKTFKDKRRKDLAGNRAILYEVYIQIVDKILKNGLKSNVTPEGLAGYLEKVVHNETITWLRKQKVKKNVIITLEQAQTISLQTPVGPEGTQTLGGMVQGDDPAEHEESGRTQQEVARLLADIAALDPEKRFIFKAYLMFYDSLSDGDIREIAKRRTKRVKAIRAEVASLQEKLVQREAQRLRHQDLAGIAWYLVQKLERRLMGLNGDPDAERTEIVALQEELEHQRKRHEKSVEKAAVLVRPTNEEICRLLGLDAQDKRIVKGISLKVFRMRKGLRGAGNAGAGPPDSA